MLCFELGAKWLLFATVVSGLGGYFWGIATGSYLKYSGDSDLTSTYCSIAFMFAQDLPIYHN